MEYVLKVSSRELLDRLHTIVTSERNGVQEYARVCKDRPQSLAWAEAQVTELDNLLCNIENSLAST